MLTVRVLKPRGVALRAAAATVEVTGGLVAGHAWAGGSLPSATWVALMAGTVFGLGLLVLRGRLRASVALPGLVALQLLMHAWLTVLTPHDMTAMHDHVLLDPRMLAVHVAGAALTAAAWELRAVLAEVVLTWTAAPPTPKPAVRRLRTRTHDRPTRARASRSTAPRRGPPRELAPA